MARIVQKYGGSSVRDPERILAVARRVRQYRDRGDELIVVVSAMGGVTDRLIALAKELNPDPNEREMDMLLATGEQQSVALLAMALHGLGCPAISFTGAQAGIETDATHSKARIRDIQPRRIREMLDQGKVVIVAGFQGRSVDDAITTLGRGGSDLSAVALAAVLKADLCQIYTDVDGVFTADPRLAPEARKIDRISHDEMLELASLGAKVMQARSIEFAKKYGVDIEVRSSLNDRPGTLITKETRDMEDVVIRGVSADRTEAKLTVTRVPDRPGQAARLFQILARAAINVDMIVQNVSADGFTDTSFTVPRADLDKIRQRLAERIQKEVRAEDILYDEKIAKVSAVGIGMRSHSGIASKMFTVLAEQGINIEMIATSEIKISCVIREQAAEAAVRALHTAFGLGETGPTN